MEDMMVNYDPPSGVADLNGQVNDIEAEKAELARERAELEQEKALVRQRRVQEDQRPTVLEPSGEPVMQEPPRPYSPAVVDSSGEEFEIDVETGEPIRDGFGQPIPKWKHQTVEFQGEPLQVRKPQPMAIQAFAMAASQYTPESIRVDMMTRFVQSHISQLSFQRLLAKMMDPDGGFTVNDFGKVVELIATLDTGRPTEPSNS